MKNSSFCDTVGFHGCASRRNQQDADGKSGQIRMIDAGATAELCLTALPHLGRGSVSIRSIARFAWPVVLTLGALTGCAEGPRVSTPYPYATADRPAAEQAPGTEAAPSVAELNARLADADEVQPYSGTLDMRSNVSGGITITMTGQMNFNAPFTGYMQIRTSGAKGPEAINMNQTITERFVYARNVNDAGAEKGPWRRVSRAAMGETSVPKLNDYARLLLDQGPDVIKGEDTREEVSGTRLSGHIRTDDVETVEPALYNRLRAYGVDEFACDVWVDRSGRTFHLEQWAEMKGFTTHNTLTVSELRPPVTVKVPANPITVKAPRNEPDQTT
jgi:hypothetical protein